MIKEDFKANGWAKIDYDAVWLAEYRRVLEALSQMQARKLGAPDTVAELEVARMASNTAAGKRLSAEIGTHIGAILELPLTCVITGPALLTNRPGDHRSLYTWHCESHWYPKRRNFINIWTPFRVPKTKDNGCMQLIPKTHTKHWDFAEYYGYGEEGDENYLLQYEVPQCEVPWQWKVDCVGNPGTFYIFDRGLLHRSTPNQTDDPSYALTFRVFDYSDDLTISADWAERPYRIGEKSPLTGRPNMVTRGH